jgi:hypothetical protein
MEPKEDEEGEEEEEEKEEEEEEEEDDGDDDDDDDDEVQLGRMHLDDLCIRWIMSCGYYCRRWFLRFS